jgi:branched-chain amino acid transport system ATP-binding protein
MAGMNADEKVELGRFISNVNQALRTTIVLIEHDIGVVMGLSHHVVVLDYGKKVGDGTPEEVRRNPDVVAAYLGVKH